MLRVVVILVAVLCNFVSCVLWPKGVVHYAINKKDYDIHSQDLITTTIEGLEHEICVKFFNTPLNYTATVSDKILYIDNPDKKKDCPPSNYDFTGNVVNMPIGYKCLNPKEIARIVVDMLRSSVSAQTPAPINSYDLVKKFNLLEDDPSRPSLLSPADRNYVNGMYAFECALLSSRPGLDPSYRRTITDMADDGGKIDANDLPAATQRYYKDKLWPLGIVMYGICKEMKESAEEDVKLLRQAMVTIELDTCIVFQELADDQELEAKNFLWFSHEGEEAPQYGFREGNQTISLKQMTHGAAGHSAHPIVNLLLALGMPMASNRPDRDNYVTINWKNVIKGKERYLERIPASGWLRQLPYDLESVSHAPANYLCGDACKLYGRTVQPIQDHLWHRTMTMGHSTRLSETDKRYIKILYGDIGKQCQYRLLPKEK